MNMSKTIRAGIVLAVIAVIAAIAIGPVRLYNARKKADEFAAEKGIKIQYEVSENIGSREALLTELWQIALWEEKTRTEINDVFGQSDKEYKEGDNLCYIQAPWGEIVEVPAAIGGKLVEINAKRGSKVMKGDVIAYIERPHEE